jgi:hypothetical protein
VELVIARNPDPESRLSYLLRVPLGAGLVFSTAGTWPRTNALYCHPVGLEHWPDEPEIVERVALRSCRRRGAAVDLIADRARENRSQLVFTTARGRDAVFWQTPRVRKQARPQVRTPIARASGVNELEVVVDAHERYAYRFDRQAVCTVSRALPCGDYGIVVDGRLAAAVERKSLADLVASLTGGKLHYALGDLAALPRAALVVEDRYSQVFKLDRVRPAVVADGLAEEWTYRYLAAAYTWATSEPAAVARIAGAATHELLDAPSAPDPSTAEVRAWARANDIPVPGRGRLRPEVWDAWHSAHARHVGST